MLQREANAVLLQSKADYEYVLLIQLLGTVSRSRDALRVSREG